MSQVANTVYIAHNLSIISIVPEYTNEEIEKHPLALFSRYRVVLVKFSLLTRETSFSRTRSG